MSTLGCYNRYYNFSYFNFFATLKKVHPVVIEYCSGCCLCLMLRCEICILFHFSCFVVVMILSLYCTYLFGWFLQIQNDLLMCSKMVTFLYVGVWLVWLYRAVHCEEVMIKQCLSTGCKKRWHIWRQSSGVMWLASSFWWLGGTMIRQNTGNYTPNNMVSLHHSASLLWELQI
jgi:hypothetical protein